MAHDRCTAGCLVVALWMLAGAAVAVPLQSGRPIDLAGPRQHGLDAPRPHGASLPQRVLILLVDFPDRPHAANITPAVIDSLFFGATGSVRDYYRRSSFGRLEIDGSVVGWLRLPQAHDYYADSEHEGLGVRGAYPRNARRMVEDALHIAFTRLDPSSFDADGDGLVDALVVVHAGTGADRGDTHEILSHNWTTTDVVRAASGVGGWHYATVAEISPLGTCAHEFGHQLGLPDLYQSGSLAGLGGGLGDWSLMASGAWLGGTDRDGTEPADLDAPSKLDLGFIDPSVTVANRTGLPLHASGAGPGDVYIAWTHGRPDLEYFVIENRQPRGLDARLPGGGMLVYHVDRRSWNNDDVDHPRAALLQADGRNDIERRVNNGDALDPYPGRTGLLDDFTHPDTRARDGTPTQIRVANISTPSASMTFDLQIETTPHVEILAQAARETSGDGDGFPEAGESVGLDLRLVNVGLDASPLTVTATSADAEWISSTTTLPRLAKDDTAIVAFALVPHTGLLDPTGLALHIRFESPTWTDSTTRTLGLGSQLGFDACLQPLPSQFTRDCPDPELPWTVDSAKGPGVWSLESRSGDLAHVYRSAAGPRYGNGVDVALVSPPFLLESHSTLHLLHSIDAQAGPGGVAYDGGRVEISLDGAAWEGLEPQQSSGYTFLARSVPALAGMATFSGTGPRRWDGFDCGTRHGSARLRFRFVSGDSIGASGWEIARVRVVPGSTPDPAGTQLAVAAEPNPVRLPAQIAFTVTSSLTEPARSTTLSVYDARGRLVRQLAHEPIPASMGRFLWDGRDANGRLVASGVYVARLDWGTTGASTKVLVVH